AAGVAPYTSRFSVSPAAISGVRFCQSVPHFFSVILRVCRFYGRRSIAGHNGLSPPLRCSSSFLSQTRLPAREGPAAETPATRFHCYGKWNFGALLALLLILVFVPNGV